MPVLDTSLLIENRVQAVREFQQAANLGRAQIDISGGVDSATVGALLVLALGADNVTAVFSGIHSSPMARNLAHRQAEALGLKLIDDDLTREFDNRLRRMKNALKSAGYDLETIEARIAEDPTVLGSFRSTLRAPLGRAYNRLTGDGLRYGTGNECEDRFLRFYQKGGDGEVDCNPLAMLSKGEVYQLAFALGVIPEVLQAAPTPDLWNGLSHTDEAELKKLTGVAWTYSRVSEGRYLHVGSIERVSRWLDTVGDALFDDRRSVEELASGRWYGPVENHNAFAGLSNLGVRKLLDSAKKIERATRHKANPNCPSLGTRDELAAQGILTNTLPVLLKDAA